MALCSSGISSTLVNQLTNANMSRRSYTTWQNNLTSWNTAYTFDLNGNIQSLFREGAPDIDGYPTNLDNLSYTYQGNKITAIADSYGHLGFADLATTTEEYLYDANGNMIEDKNKGISQIRYNRMNLPVVITFSNGNEIHYLYDAGGSKLQKIAIPAAGGQTTTDYSGGFVYTNNSIDFFAFSEGRVRKVSGNWQYQYDLKDHLGNVRTTFTNDNGVATLLQADSYYPFGYKMPGLSYQTGAENKFTYNGKELEDEFGLDWYHYGARFYDPTVGRWWVIDPMDEFPSPYAYVGNTPIMLVDPNGMNSDDPPENGATVGAIIGGSIRAGWEHFRYNSARRIAIWFGSEKAESMPYRKFDVYIDPNSIDGVSVSFEDYSEDPSFGSRMWNSSIAILDMTAINPASQGTAMFAKAPKLFVSEIAQNVTKNFGNTYCLPCSEALVNAFKNEGITGQVIELRSETALIVSKTFGYSEAISRSGMHRGVLVDGMVYDNIHKKGIAYDDWIKDFESHGNISTKIVEDF